MMKHFIYPASLFLLAICHAIPLSAATSQTIHAQWQYDVAINDLAGFRLYLNGSQSCEFTDPSVRSADCQVSLPDSSADFTMTAFTSTGQESSHSTVYTLPVSITPNQAPVAISKSYTIDEDAVLNDTLSATDPEGAAITFEVSSISGNYTEFNWTPAGSFSFFPEQPGTFAFLFRANDGQTLSNEATVTVIVNPVNHPPVAKPDTASTREKTAITINVLANDSDPDGDRLTVTAASLPAHGSAVVSANSITYTPTNGYLGSDTFTYTISDNAGGTANANVAITVYPAIDNTPPIVTPPSAITTNATGLYTDVYLGTAPALDAVDGSLIAVPDQSGPFVPGVHTITWSATDSSGNRGVALQTIRILPLASFGPDQLSGEGKIVRVPVYLNGTAPAYPVSIPYTINGTASGGSDHNAVAGSVTIASGTFGYIEFNVLTDSTMEADETIIFTFGQPSNAVRGVKRAHTVTITESNVQPHVRLRTAQNNLPTLTAYQNSGLFTVTAEIDDPNPNDFHSLDWTGTDSRLSPPSNRSTAVFTIDPSRLQTGIYPIKIQVADSGSPSKTITTQGYIRIASSSAKPSYSYADTDLDGIPDAIDPDNLPFALPIIMNGVIGDVLETEPGVRLRLGAVALSTGSPDAGVDNTDIGNFESENGSNPNYAYDGITYDFIVDFEIAGLPRPGTTAKLVMPIFEGIPPYAVYRKYIPGTGWVDFTSNEKNRIASAFGQNGTCPPAGSSFYTTGLTIGDTCIELTIEDGGPNDTDGLVNGVIKDPSGLGVAAPNGSTIASTDTQKKTPTSSSGGGGGGCVLKNDAEIDPTLILLLAASAFFLFRRGLRKK